MLVAAFFAFTLFAVCTPQILAQTANTGALTGTVTDPSGAVISGATVKVTDLATGQTRTATTDANGSYKISLLPPGNYSVHFGATGFRSLDVPNVTINVAETPTLNRKLEVGTSTQQVTVEANTQSIQTQGATNGTVVGSQEIEALPLVSRNYTQIIDLSPGVIANVANASAMGNGTQNVSANGQGGISNSYSMDGANISQYTSGGAAQMGSFAGIAIPNPDTIQEFKVQTSLYDAAYGRNSGANVEVITKTGSNNFHGDVWEFNRNNFFNANDYFYKNSELRSGEANKPQVLKQNTFGFTFGGPIKKNKIFFFGSYQGFRQLNGIATSGFSNGYEPAATLMPFNDYADLASGACSDLRCTNNIPAYRTYLGSVFGPGTSVCAPFATAFGVPTYLGAPQNCSTGWTDGVTIQNNGAQITNTAIALLQAKGNTKGGYNQGFWIAGAPNNCVLTHPGVPSSGCPTAMSLPTHANENQYMANSQYSLSPKETLYENYFLSSDPQLQSFDCLFIGSCNPGSPANVLYENHVGTLRLQSILSNNLINEARFTFQRNVEDASETSTLESCDLPNGATIVPLNNNGQPCSANVALPYKEFGIVPSVDVLDLYSTSGDWNQGTNYVGVGENISNVFQVGDQVSWNHGMHSISFGFDGEWDQYNNTTVASGRGEILFDNTADFLTSSSGAAIDGTPQTGLPPSGGTPYINGTCGYLGTATCAGGESPIGLRGLLTHYNRIKAFDWFVQDGIRVNSKLTVTAGLRWEYDGWPSDKIGQFTNLWQSQMALVNTGSYFLNDAATTSCVPAGAAPGTLPTPVGTLAGFVVPSNFDKAAGLSSLCGATGVKVNGNASLLAGSPLDNFEPRLGVAWQPIGSRLVVRAGYGWYHDRAGSIFLVDGLLDNPPYSGTLGGTSITNLENTLHSPFQATAGTPLSWNQRFLYVAGSGPNGTGGDPNAVCYGGQPGCTTTQIISSALGYTSNSNLMSQRLPLTQQYSLDLQYDLGHGWVADVGYVGSHSIHLLDQGLPYNIEHLVDCGAASATCNAPTLPQDIGMFSNPNFPGGNPIPFNDPANTTPVTVNTTDNGAARVSYLGFGPGVSTTTTLGDGLYNSLQAQLRHNFSHGVLLQASYTWSKNLTNINAAETGELDTGNTDFGTNGSNNPFDLAQQYGLYSGQRSQRLIVSYSYSLPWKSTSGFSGKILGGWTLSGITTVQNGQPFTVTDSGGGSMYGASTSRALLADPVDCGKNGVCKSGIAVAVPGSDKQRVLADLPGSPTYTGVGWINPNAFTAFSSLPASSPYCIGGVQNPGPYGTPSPSDTCGTMPAPPRAPNTYYPGDPGAPADPGAPFLGAGTGWGDAPIGIVTGPGQWNWNMSLQKDTKITEGTTLQFRAEFYNVWNHTQFSNPLSTGEGGSTFGQINSTLVTPRVMQFGLKFLF